MKLVNRRGKKVDFNENVLLGDIQLAAELAAVSNNLNESDLFNKVKSGVFDGMTTKELGVLVYTTAAAMVVEDYEYGKLAGMFLSGQIDKECSELIDENNFLNSITYGWEKGIVNVRVHDFVVDYHEELQEAIDYSRTRELDYFGIARLYKGYLLADIEQEKVFENIQHFFMRIAVALTTNLADAIETYDLISTLKYMPATPTLLNAGTTREQLSSCFLMDSPKDNLVDIYKAYSDIALLSKYSGGIGISYSRVRSNGSTIAGTRGKSNGIIPWLTVLDKSAMAVRQGAVRKGAIAVFLETWHADILDFLESKDEGRDEDRHFKSLNIVNWIPDLFMKRVKENKNWSLFDPKKTPDLVDLWGDKFEEAYGRYEEAGLAEKVVPAVELYGKMMRVLGTTGQGWVCFKDRANATCNQTLLPDNVVHCSNLCLEIVQCTTYKETAVCNLGSLNLTKFVTRNIEDTGYVIQYEELGRAAYDAVRLLDRVIDLNYYVIGETENSNKKWRAVGLGYMGLHDLLMMLKVPFESDEAKGISTSIAETVYWHALRASTDLSAEKGVFPAWDKSRTSQGVLQPHLWDNDNSYDSSVYRWNLMGDWVKKHGLRNSLLIAPAPTATIASIAGCSSSIEPMTSNLVRRETVAGTFLQVNKYLVDELKERGLWTEEVRNQLRVDNGSVKNLPLPEDVKAIYKTAFEMSMKKIIDMAASRGRYIDQSQSLNLFIDNPTIGKLSSLYMYAFEKGLKTTYYLKQKPASDIKKVVEVKNEHAKVVVDDTAAVVCSIENKEECEACQ